MEQQTAANKEMLVSMRNVLASSAEQVAAIESVYGDFNLRLSDLYGRLRDFEAALATPRRRIRKARPSH